MTNDEYDQLLARIHNARDYVAASMAQLATDQAHLDGLLADLEAEERSIARKALASTHSASRKLVVGE